MEIFLITKGRVIFRLKSFAHIASKLLVDTNIWSRNTRVKSVKASFFFSLTCF